VPGGFSFNQYLIVDEQPLLFHTGSRRVFPAVSDSVRRIIPLKQLRYVGFSHHEQDEDGALNQFLAAADRAVPLCGTVNALINGDGMDRPPRVLRDGGILQLGECSVRWIDAPTCLTDGKQDTCSKRRRKFCFAAIYSRNRALGTWP